MAFTRNTVFYTDIECSGKALKRLYYFPASATDLPEVPTLQEFPPYFINPDIKVSSGYPNDLPKGVPKTALMKFTIDLDMMFDQGANNWSDVRKWITENASPSQRYIYGTNPQTIRNIWYLNEAIGIGLTEYRFCGIQDLKPKTSYKFDKDNRGKVEITAIDINRAAMDILSFDIISAFLSIIIYTQDSSLIDSKYTDTGDYTTFGLTKSGLFNDLIQTESFRTTYEIIYEHLARAAYAGLTRNPRVNVVVHKNAFDHYEFYEQNGLKDAQVGSSIADVDLLHIPFIKTSGGVIIGGMYSSKSEGSLKNYKNAYDILKHLSDAYLSKIRFRTVMSLGSPIEVLGNINYHIISSRLFSADYAAGVEPDIDITDKEIIDGYGVEYNAEIVVRGISHLAGVHENDLDEIEYTLGGNLSQDANESKMSYHNHPTGISGVYVSGSDLTGFQKFTNVQKLCYESGSFIFTAHDYCTLDLGDGITITPESIATDPDYPNDLSDAFIDTWQIWINERLNHSGIGYVVAKAGLIAFGNDGQFIYETTIPAEFVEPQDLGRRYNFDWVTIFPYDFHSGIYANTKGILVSYERDEAKNVATCKFFFKGV